VAASQLLLHGYDTGHTPGRLAGVPLSAVGAARRYFRVLPRAGASFVAAVYPAPFDAESASAVVMARLFDQVPLTTPRLLGHAADLGVLVFEDLGDLTLQAHRGAAPPGEHRALYRQAVAAIAALQARGRTLASAAALPSLPALDADVLAQQLDGFVCHFIEAYRGVVVPSAARAALAEEWAAVAQELADEPRVLCHGGFHSRHLAVRDGRLVILDVEGARMGPDTYDLASLLRDGYADVEDDAAGDLIAYFLAIRADAPASQGVADFRRRFDLASLQRSLGQAGALGYQAAVAGNAVAIRYLPRTLRAARHALAAYPRFARLHDLLSSYVEEFR